MNWSGHCSVRSNFSHLKESTDIFLFPILATDPFLIGCWDAFDGTEPERLNHSFLVISSYPLTNSKIFFYSGSPSQLTHASLHLLVYQMLWPPALVNVLTQVQCSKHTSLGTTSDGGSFYPSTHTPQNEATVFSWNLPPAAVACSVPCCGFYTKEISPGCQPSKRGKFSGPQRGGQAIISASAQDNPVIFPRRKKKWFYSSRFGEIGRMHLYFNPGLSPQPFSQYALSPNTALSNFLFPT